MAIQTYTRYRDYSDFQSSNPNTEYNGADFDTDFDRIKTFSDAASAAIADVRRDDGQLKNASVGLDQIKSELVPFLNKAVTFKGDWATATAYAVNDFVAESSSNYVCLVAHTSGTFATDLAAGKWQLVSTTGSTGATGAGYAATSATSIAIGTGSKSFTTQSGLAYTVGARVRVSSDGTSTAWMEGLVSAYSGTTLTVEVAVTSGTGTKADWNINLAGEPGSSAMPGYLFGLTLSNDATTPDEILDIAAGRCTDSTGTATINLATAITKDVTASWASGDGNGGMGVGITVAASTWYHVFAILNDGVADVYFDTDADATNAPSGTTALRRIGSVKTDSDGEILPFIQAGRTFHLTVVNEASYTATQTATLTTLSSVPLGVVVRPIAQAIIGVGASVSTSRLQVAPAANAAMLWTLNAVQAFATTSPITSVGTPTIAPPTNTSAQIYVAVPDISSGASLTLVVMGWVDDSL
jgi:hypothetical protein